MNDCFNCRKQDCSVCQEEEKLLNTDWDLVVADAMDLSVFIDKHEDILYEKHNEEMPYGVAKGRTGTPDEWLFDYYDRELVIQQRAIMMGLLVVQD